MTTGPAYHVSFLSGRLPKDRYDTLLVYGRVLPGEGDFAERGHEEGANMHFLPSLGPEVHPLRDLQALLALTRIVRRLRPEIVHTHTAKAGTLGRIAAWLGSLGRSPRPLVLHTYHGHVLEGYFGPRTSAAYRMIERGLARGSDCLIGVSTATVDDLVRLGVAPRERFRTIPVGLDLDRFSQPSPAVRRAFREQLGVSEDEVLLLFSGRLVPIKRVDVLLHAVSRAVRRGARVRLAIIGDGPLREDLERLAATLGVAGVVSFRGFAADVSAATAGADVAVLSSDNEGTPVALIEAAAAGRPAVATSVGGVPDVVIQGTGLLVPRGDHEAFADALLRLAGDEALRKEMGCRAQEHVLASFTSDRLVRDITQLYHELLQRAPAT